MVSERIHVVRGTSACCHHEKGSMEQVMRVDLQPGANISFNTAFQKQSALKDFQRRFEEFRSYLYQERELMKERITNLEFVVHHQLDYGENAAAREIILFQLQNNVADAEGRVASLEEEKRTLQTNLADMKDQHVKIVADMEDRLSCLVDEEKRTLQPNLADMEGRVASLEEEKRTLQANLADIADRHGKIVADMEGRVASLEEEKRTLQSNLADIADRHGKIVADMEGRVASLEEKKRTIQTNLADMKDQHVKIVADMEGHLSCLVDEEKRTLQANLADIADRHGKIVANMEDRVAKLEEEKHTLQRNLADIEQFQSGVNAEEREIVLLGQQRMQLAAEVMTMKNDANPSPSLNDPRPQSTVGQGSGDTDQLRNRVASLEEEKRTLQENVDKMSVRVASLEEEKSTLQTDLANREVQTGKLSESTRSYSLNSATPTDVSQAFRGISSPVIAFNSSLSKCIPASVKTDRMRSSNYKDVSCLEPSQASALILKAEVMSILFENFENESFSAGGHSVYPDPAKRKTKFFALFQNSEKGAYDDQFLHYHDRTKTRVQQTFCVNAKSVGKPLTLSMNQAFRKAAEKVWALHLLSFSFEPPVSLFRVPRGADFDENYMEPTYYSGADGKLLEKAAFMLTPGLRSSEFPTVKAEIYPLFKVIQ